MLYRITVLPQQLQINAPAGDKPEDQMPNCQFKLEKGQAEGQRPMVLTDAIQVIECTWAREVVLGILFAG